MGESYRAKQKTKEIQYFMYKIQTLMNFSSKLSAKILDEKKGGDDEGCAVPIAQDKFPLWR